MGYGLGIRASRGTWDELESLGIFGWDGAFYTRLWVDPAENLIGVFMTQIGGAVRQTGLTNRYRVLVYQAICGQQDVIHNNGCNRIFTIGGSDNEDVHAACLHRDAYRCGSIGTDSR